MAYRLYNTSGAQDVVVDQGVVRAGRFLDVLGVDQSIRDMVAKGKISVNPAISGVQINTVYTSYTAPVASSTGQINLIQVTDFPGCNTNFAALAAAVNDLQGRVALEEQDPNKFAN